MRLSTKIRYGIRLMIDLAQHQGQGWVLLKDIARRQGISQKYLWQVVSPLKAGKLVISGRGAKGGYSLAKPAESISINEITKIMDDQFTPVACLENSKGCRRSGKCAAQDLWEELGRKIEDFLDSISLQEMALRQARKQGVSLESMYFI